MNTKQYKVSQMGLRSQPDALVKLRFDTGVEVEAQLESLPNVLRKEGLRNKMPVRVEINGMKGGAFPCIIARSELAAAFISGRVGYNIGADDGVSFATQAAAAKLYAAVRDAGAPAADLKFEWLLGPKVEALQPKQLALKLMPEEEQLPF